MIDFTPNHDGQTPMQAVKLAIEQSLREAVNLAVLKHQQLGLPMVVWQDGRVVWIPADELTIDDPLALS